MNALKRYLGIVWVAGGVLLAILLTYKAVNAFSAAAVSAEDYVFWAVIVTIFIPIIIGFVLFGYYALMGEYGES